MSRLVVALALLGVAPAPVAGQPKAAPEALDLVLPGGGRLRLELVVEGEAPAARWGTFLDRWFAHHDRDGDGRLSRTEAARLPALPVAGGDIIHLDFARADADKDEALTRDEFKGFYRVAGFAPVQVAVEAPTAADLQTAAALFRHFGPDARGALGEAELRRGDRLLRKLDENEDEVLTPAEVLSLGTPPAVKAPARSGFRWAPAAAQAPPNAARLTLPNAAESSVRVEIVGKSAHLLKDGNRPARVHLEGVVLTPARGADYAGGAAGTRGFALALFRLAAGSKGSVEKRQIQDDASLQMLADLFPHADRDNDGKLTTAELEAYLDLVALGVNRPLVVTVADGGRNLFRHLDADGDGRLSREELGEAPRLLALTGGKGLTPDGVPHTARVTVRRGLTCGAFGPIPLVPLVAPQTSPATAPAGPRRGPAWFRAMDRNGDGHLSSREFLGPAELFRRLDLNGDGVISADEAERATAGP